MQPRSYWLKSWLAHFHKNLLKLAFTLKNFANAWKGENRYVPDMLNTSDDGAHGACRKLPKMCVVSWWNPTTSLLYNSRNFSSITCLNLVSYWHFRSKLSPWPDESSFYRSILFQSHHTVKPSCSLKWACW